MAVKVTTAELPELIIDVISENLVPMIHGSPGIGKALANSEQVLTPTGFVPMKTLRAGDKVITCEGKITPIKYITNQGIRPIYKVSFRDGTSVRCDEEHLWQVKERTRKNWQLMTTHQLMKIKLTTFEPDSRNKSTRGTHRYNYHIPQNQPVEFEKACVPLPLHPYILGVLLGDGCLGQASISLTNPRKDIFDKVEALLPVEYTFSTRIFKNGAYSARIIMAGAKKTFKAFLKSIDPKLLVNSIYKHIPQQYQLASKEERMELFNGLNDTDGCWKGKRLIGFDVSSKQLHEDYLFVARSLGMQFSTSQRETTHNTSYRAFYIKDHGRNTFNSITAIDYVGEEAATCISIEDDSKLFLTSGFKPTHNSDIIQAIAKRFNLFLIDVRLSQSDPTDMNGFPALNKEKTRSTYLPMETFPIEGDAIPDNYKGWLIFFDEFTSAPQSVQAAAYKVILDKKIGKHNIHKKVRMICAGNLATDRAIVNRLSTAMQSRLIHFELEVDPKAWITWATAAEIDYRIISFIGFKSSALQNFDPNHTDHTFACGRTWEFASKLIKKYTNIPGTKIPLLAGTLGEAAGREFYSYSKIFPDLPSIASIMRDPKNIEVPNEPSVCFALAGTIGSQLTPENANKLMPFVSRLDPEFMILTLQGVHQKFPELYTIPSVKQWLSKHSAEFFPG